MERLRRIRAYKIDKEEGIGRGSSLCCLTLSKDANGGGRGEGVNIQTSQ